VKHGEREAKAIRLCGTTAGPVVIYLADLSEGDKVDIEGRMAEALLVRTDDDKGHLVS
jgi:hypothetical protein